MTWAASDPAGRTRRTGAAFLRADPLRWIVEMPVPAFER